MIRNSKTKKVGRTLATCMNYYTDAALAALSSRYFLIAIFMKEGRRTLIELCIRINSSENPFFRIYKTIRKKSQRGAERLDRLSSF